MTATDDENAADLALTAFCWWRPDLRRSVAETYWRDVHGIMFARVPGLWQCRQLRLAANRPDLWPTDHGISFTTPEAAQPHGISHGLFRTESDLAMFAQHPLAAKTIPEDTATFVDRIGALLSPERRGRTLTTPASEPVSQGAPRVPTFALCVVPHSQETTPEGFHDYLVDHLATTWSQAPGVIRLRVEPLPPYNQSVMKSPGVPNQWPTDKTYLGWIEIAVHHENVLISLLAHTPSEDLRSHVAAIHTYPVREIYTLIASGRPTDVGLRGYPAVQTIEAARATGQNDPATLELLFGTTSRGLEGLRQ